MNIRRNILVVDDHDSIRILLGSLLNEDYDVAVKKDGMDAMAWLSKGNFPDLILLDLSMPVMTGMELLRNIRTSGFFKEIPVIILSAVDDHHQQQMCRDLGIIDFIPKPFNPVTLKEKIKSAMVVPEQHVIYN